MIFVVTQKKITLKSPWVVTHASLIIYVPRTSDNLIHSTRNENVFQQPVVNDADVQEFEGKFVFPDLKSKNPQDAEINLTSDGTTTDSHLTEIWDSKLAREEKLSELNEVPRRSRSSMRDLDAESTSESTISINSPERDESFESKKRESDREKSSYNIFDDCVSFSQKHSKSESIVHSNSDSCSKNDEFEKKDQGLIEESSVNSDLLCENKSENPLLPWKQKIFDFSDHLERDDDGILETSPQRSSELNVIETKKLNDENFRATFPLIRNGNKTVNSRTPYKHENTSRFDSIAELFIHSFCNLYFLNNHCKIGKNQNLSGF